jgi:hypothetical protein
MTTTTEHVCRFTGGGYDHPLPPERPERLTGPEVGAIVRYQSERYPKWDGLLMRVKERSYVWSPGECSSHGGFRHYDWKVVEWPVLSRDGHVVFKTMVVDDKDLEPAT